MFRIHATIIDLDGQLKEADYHFDNRKSARHWMRRNIRRGWIQEATLFFFAGRTPLGTWKRQGQDFVRLAIAA